MLKRILAGGLAIVMAVGSSNGNSSAGTLTTIPEEAKQDIISYLTDGAISSEETVMTVNGVEIPASAYFYQWAYYAGYMAYYYQGKDETDTFSLDKEINGLRHHRTEGAGREADAVRRRQEDHRKPGGFCG